MTKELIKRHLYKAKIINSENLNFFFDKLRISDKNNILSYKITDCHLRLKDDFLFLRIPIENKYRRISSGLFIVKVDSKELSDRYNSIINSNKFRYSHLRKIILYIFFGLAVLSIIWKLDLYILNKYFYLQNRDNWEIIRIENDKMIIIDNKSLDVDYLGLDNNFTKNHPDSYKTSFFVHYRYEVFSKVRLLYGSGNSFYKIEELIGNDNLLGSYNFKFENDTLRLMNKDYHITCVKKK